MVADDNRSVKDKACEMAAMSITSTIDPDYRCLLRGQEDRAVPYKRPGPCPCTSRNDSVKDGLHPTEGRSVEPKTGVQRFPDRAWWNY